MAPLVISFASPLLPHLVHQERDYTLQSLIQQMAKIGLNRKPKFSIRFQADRASISLVIRFALVLRKVLWLVVFASTEKHQSGSSGRARCARDFQKFLNSLLGNVPVRLRSVPQSIVRHGFANLCRIFQRRWKKIAPNREDKLLSLSQLSSRQRSANLIASHEKVSLNRFMRHFAVHRPNRKIDVQQGIPAVQLALCARIQMITF